MNERKVAGREQFLSVCAAVKKEDVPFPELGDGVVVPVWQFTSREKTEWEHSCITEGPKANSLSARERLVIAVCRDDNGVSLFTREDVARLAKCSIGFVERIVNVAYRLNKVTEEDIAALTKNSEPTNEG